MPRAFDITSATDSVNLDASGRGELSFTVSNALGAPVRARITVLPSGDARPEWTSIKGGAERDFTADGTQQVTVQFQVPPGTPPGRFTFQLLVADVTNPDERYAQGPTAAFVVPTVAPVAQKKPFPWMLVALVGGIVVIIAVVVGIIAGHGGPELGEACPEGDCGKGLQCTGADGGVCLGQAGFKTCKSDDQCVTGLCKDGKCEQVPPGGACKPNGSCPPQQKCVQVASTRFCLLVAAQKCERDLDCSSLFCKDKVCARDDGRCDTNADCKSPSTCSPSKVCLLPDGQACTTPTMCLSGFCPAGTCAPAPTAQQCPFVCPDGTTCVNGGCISVLRSGAVINQQLFLEKNAAQVKELEQLQLRQERLQR